MDILTLRVAARFQTAARPVPIDKKGIAQFVEKTLMPGIVRWLKHQSNQDEPLGDRTGIIARELEVESVDGKELLLAEVIIKSVGSKGKWAAVLGGSSGSRRWESGQGRIKVTLWLNGALTPADFLVPQPGTDRLQPLSRCTYETCLPYGLYSILIHELTHTAESMFQKVPEYLRGVDNPMAEKPREYVNDPQEVRAFMQQVVDEAVKGARHLRSHAKSNQWLINYSLRMSTTWKIIEPDMTHANKAKILKAVYEAFEKEGLLLDDNMAVRVAARYKEKKKVRSEDGGKTTVYVYSERQVQHRNREKAKRLEKLSKSIRDLRAKVKRDLRSDDPEKKLTALAVSLIDATYERVGNEESASGKSTQDGKKHFGVTGWKRKHVSFKPNAVFIKYMGKSGVQQEKQVTDATVRKALRDAYEAIEDKDDDLFVWDGGKVTPEKVNNYLSQFNITSKDLRGWHANDEMRRALKEVRNKGSKLAEDKKERTKQLKAEFKKALEEVAQIVGHESSTLRQQYLVPNLEKSYMKDGTVIDKLASSNELNMPLDNDEIEKNFKHPERDLPEHTHYRVLCHNCGAVLRQCRCFGEKAILYEDGPCFKCRKIASISEITEEMAFWFEKRTKMHINLVQKYCHKIEAYDPVRFAGLSEQAKEHDKSKYEEPEREPYIYITWQYYCKDHDKKFDAPKDLEKQMSKATEHHVKANPHHPEYHSLEDVDFSKREDRDKPPDKIVDATKMPVMDIAEMAADWMAMSEEKESEPKDWADKNVNVRWKFSLEQKNLIYELLELYSTTKVAERVAFRFQGNKNKHKQLQHITDAVCNKYNVSNIIIKVSDSYPRSGHIAEYITERIRGGKFYIPKYIIIFEWEEMKNYPEEWTYALAHELAHHVLNVQSNNIGHPTKHNHITSEIENYIKSKFSQFYHNNEEIKRLRDKIIYWKEHKSEIEQEHQKAGLTIDVEVEIKKMSDKLNTLL